MKINLGEVKVEIDDIVSVMPPREKVCGTIVTLRNGIEIVTTRKGKEIIAIIEQQKRVLTFTGRDGNGCHIDVTTIVGVVEYIQLDGDKVFFRGSKIHLDDGCKFVVCDGSKEVLRKISVVLAKGAE